MGLVTSRQFAGQLESIRVHFFTGAFFVYPVITPIPVDLLLLTDTCIIIYVACFIVAFRSRDGFLTGLQRLRQVRQISFKSSWLVAMPLVSSALLLIVLVTSIVLSQAGVSSGQLCTPPNMRLPNPCPSEAELYASLTYAPISEEIAFRIDGLEEPFNRARIKAKKPFACCGLISVSRISESQGGASHDHCQRATWNPLDRMDLVIPNFLFLWDRPCYFGRNRLGNRQISHRRNLGIRVGSGLLELRSLCRDPVALVLRFLLRNVQRGSGCVRGRRCHPSRPRLSSHVDRRNRLDLGCLGLANQKIITRRNSNNL